MELGLLEKGVLAAVLRGYTGEEELLGLFRGVDPEVVRAALRRLVSMGLLRPVERRRLLFFRERGYVLTEDGLRAAERALSEIREIVRRHAARRGALGVEGLEPWLIALAAALGLIAAWELGEALAEAAEGFEADWGDAGLEGFEL